MELTRQFSQLNRNDANLAGGKGASLGEMTQAGIPVPDGFVVPSDSFEQFIKETDLVQEIDSILHKVKHKEIHTVESASEQIKALILAAEMPKGIADDIHKQFKKLGSEYVAVRSSATAEDGAEHAWAGQLESYLNITEKNVLNKVQHCWASLFTPRAIFYRFEKGLHSTKISVAVVIQKMVNSELSGIAFSVHPITEDYNQLIIEAGFGLGEAIVSGQITPDSYVVEKEPRRILDINVNKQKKGLYRKQNGGNEWKDIPEPQGGSQVLDTQQILELSEIVLRVEKHYGFPCDIEWAYEGGNFYVVQSRPITTITNKAPALRKEIVNMFSRKKPLHCSVRFPKIPLIYVDASIKSYIDNPYNKFMDEKPDPTSLMYMNEMFTYWAHFPSLGKISNQEAIEKVEQDVIGNIPKYKQILQNILVLTNEELAIKHTLTKALRDADETSVEIYKRFGLFIDESLIVSDKSKMQRLQEVRMMLDELVVKYLYKVYDKIILVLTENLHFDPEIVRNATSAEIIELVEGTLKNPENLINRPISYILDKGVLTLIYGDEAREINRFLEDQDPDKELISTTSISKQIKGLVGHKGVAKGKVRKLLAPDYYNKEKLQTLLGEESFILVAPMTAPELVPYFKNAIAFVTDEGGITCHAAIIARELNKPCITGTRIASHVLKDGDEVEVDANQGIIRILK